MSAQAQFYYPISRVNPEKREVEAVFFTSPRVRGDRFNLKYETIKRAATRYMEMPCIREMHQPKASGKALRIVWDDIKKTGTMVFRVVDDAAWEKVQEGVYRGLSIGGVPIICRGNDIEDFDWVETSMVDRPKDPGALFVVARAEDALAEFEPTILSADATDEELAFARGEIEEKLERFEDALPLDVETPDKEAIERYEAHQPRDDHGMWTIVAGHRISVSGKAVDHTDIHAAKAKFGLSDETTGALLSAHKAGKIANDHHLYRTLSHAEAKAGGLHALTTGHIESGIEHHATEGSHEHRWHSEAHGMAPKTNGLAISKAIGAHELKTGDVVHFPAHDGKSTIAGVVHKVTPKHVDIASSAGAAQVGVRVKKEHLKRPGFVRRDHGGGVSLLHHVEVARWEEGDFARVEKGDAMNEHAQAIADVLQRVDEGEDGDEDAVAVVAERLREIARGQADSAIEGDTIMETNSLEIERAYNARQPRDDHGKWSDGAGGISAGHAVHVMKHEGIHEGHLHDEVKEGIKSGKFKTREDVLKHIDSIHDARKNGNGSGGGTVSGHERIDREAARHGLGKEATDALHKAHDEGKIVTGSHLSRTIAAAKEATDNPMNKGEVKARHIKAALDVHGKGGSLDTPDTKSDKKRIPANPPKSDKDEKKEPPKSDKAGDGSASKAPDSLKEKAKNHADAPKKADKPGWQQKLKQLAKDTAHAFMGGYRKGREMIGRAEDGGESGDAIPALVDAFYDGLHDADDAQIEAALRAAIAQFDDENEVERVISSETPDLPVRENLEGGKPSYQKLSDRFPALQKLKSRWYESDDDAEELMPIFEETLAQMRAHFGKSGVARGVGEQSYAASEAETLQRMETLQGEVQRYEGELSIARSEVQAALSRAHDAEGTVTRLEATNDALSTDIQRLRAMPLSQTQPVTFASALPREFAVNGVLERADNPLDLERAELKAEFARLQSEMQTEPDEHKREKAAARVIAISARLDRLR